MAAGSSTAGMPNFRTRLSSPQQDQPLRVKLFGIGSAGCNMIEGTQFPTVAFSTSNADLARSHANRKLMMGVERLVGVSDSKQSVLKHLPSIAGHDILDVFNNTEVAFLFSGLGGVTGSLGTKLFSSIASARGTLDVVLVAMPFSAESIRRREMASRILSEIMSSSSLCLVFDNDKLSTLAPNLAISRAFSLMNGIMMRPVMDLCATMSRTDVPVVKQVLSGSNYGRFGLGLARGDERVERVVSESLSSPWFDFPQESVDAVMAVYSAADPWDKEAEKILSALEQHFSKARLLWGMYSDPALGDRIRLSLVLCRKK